MVQSIVQSEWLGLYQVDTTSHVLLSELSIEGGKELKERERTEREREREREREGERGGGGGKRERV